MPDAAGLLKEIKKAALEAVDAKKPAEVCFGRVISESPLQISVEQKMVLGEAQLVLCRDVTEYKIEITGDNVKDYYYIGTKQDTPTAPVSPLHVHAVGRIEITVHNGLAVGEDVLLLRMQGGQKYVVVDRLA